MNRLFVIGNGFDLHHELKTSYSHFKEYLKNTDNETFKKIQEILANEYGADEAEDWSCLESMLTCINHLDFEYFLDCAIESAENDMDRASYWGDIQYNVETDNIWVPDLKKHFDGWIREIDLELCVRDDQITLSEDDYFLNFNYTRTLQAVYNIPEEKILHIHGRQDTEKILGHNCFCSDPFKKQEFTQEDFDHGVEYDWRIEEAKEIINKLPQIYYKDSKSIIAENINFFNNIKKFDKVIFAGLSFGSEDLIYMNQILGNMDMECVVFVIYYDINDKSHIERFFEECCITNSIYFFTWEEFKNI